MSFKFFITASASPETPPKVSDKDVWLETTFDGAQDHFDYQFVTAEIGRSKFVGHCVSLLNSCGMCQDALANSDFTLYIVPELTSGVRIIMLDITKVVTN